MVGFVVLFVGVVSSELAGASTALLLAFVLPVATPAPLESIPYRMAGWLLAAAVAAVAVAFWWPAPPRSPLRGPSAQTCRLFAERLTADHRVATGELSPAGRAEVDDRLRAAYANLRDAFYATPNRPTDLGTSSRVLVRLVDELGWLLTVDEQSPPVTPGSRADARVVAVRTASAAALTTAADELDAMSHGSVRRSGEDGASRLEAALVALRRAVDVLETSAEDLPVGDLGHDGGLVDALEPTFRAQEAASAVMEITRNVAPRPRGPNDGPGCDGCSAAIPRAPAARWAPPSTGPGPTSTRARSGCTTACAAASPWAPRFWSPTCPACSTPSGSSSARSRCCARTRSAPARPCCAASVAPSSGSWSVASSSRSSERTRPCSGPCSRSRSSSRASPRRPSPSPPGRRRSP